MCMPVNQNTRCETFAVKSSASIRLGALTLALGLVFPALAQQMPDAGRTLQETKPPALPAPRPAPKMTVEPPAEGEILPGGQTVTLSSVKFAGHSVFTEAQLHAVLGDINAKVFDLAGLQQLARRISDHYRASGYPFARALIPAQNFTGGVLTILIIEGRYGKVEAEGELAGAAQGYLGSLKPGAVIAAAELERATLILGDQPGIQATPLIRPGREVGTGDLLVKVSRDRMFKGDVGLDNQGNRYSGAARLRFNAQADSPFMLGDQISLRTLYTEENMWLGSLNYSLPLGSSGLRGNVGYAHTYYELGKEFASLDAHGTAKVASAGLSHPLIRSQKTNLSLGVSYQHKRLNDQQGATNISNDKRSDSLPINLQFDHRDEFMGGGVSFGTFTYTLGHLKADAMLEAADRASNTGTLGRFDKWNLDFGRIQATGIQHLNLFARASVQWAGKNLDSSEGFFLGGANGVRAYPLGEGSGDEGWLIQLEARYQAGMWTPYAFYDAGRVRINADRDRIVPAITSNTRGIAGTGLGLRCAVGHWIADASLAWPTHGGKPESDTQDRNPRWLLLAGWRF
jgi:hemolysin activation/secretion protein